MDNGPTYLQIVDIRVCDLTRRTSKDLVMFQLRLMRLHLTDGAEQFVTRTTLNDFFHVRLPVPIQNRP